MTEESGVAADHAIGSFTREGPWTIDLDQVTWLAQIPKLRAATRAVVPALLRGDRVPPLARLVSVVSSVGSAVGAWYALDRPRGRDASRWGIARRLRRSFEALGASYVKLGQIVSSGEGLFPIELVTEFKQLRDRVAPESFADVRAIVETDLGAPIEAFFAVFEPEPIAAASIAQVHAARLRTGEEVVVKVQRPRIAARVTADIAALAWLAPRMIGRIPVTALANPPALLEVFAETIIEELDFRLEAANMLDVGRMLAEIEQRQVIVPRPHPQLVTRRVLVMERLHGYAFDDVESMHASGIDTHGLLSAGLIGFLEGALLHGVFHGDLHGGNLIVDEDGRTALLDFGITGRLDDARRVAFLRLLISGTVGDIKGQLTALRDLGAFPPDTDLDAVIFDLELEGPTKDPTQMGADEMVATLQDLTKKLMDYGARIPKELMLFVKNMIFMESATGTLAPDLDILGEVAKVYLHFVERHGPRIAAELQLEGAPAVEFDMDAVRHSFGLANEVETLTYRDLQQRRDLIRRRMKRKH